MNKKQIIEVAVSTASGIAIGYGIGLFVSDRKLKHAFEEINRELAELQDIRARMEKSGPYADPGSAYEHLVAYAEEDLHLTSTLYGDGENAVEITRAKGAAADILRDKADDKIEELHYAAANEQAVQEEAVEKIDEIKHRLSDTQPTPIITGMQQYFNDTQVTEDGQILSRPSKPRESFVEQNIFDKAESDVNEETTKPGAIHGERNPDEPYVISAQEFMDDKEGYEKVSLRYFEGDNTLVSADDDSLVPDPNACIGEVNLSRFGQGTKDPNAVHVRNEWLQSDFEVMREEGSYTEIVLGIKMDDDPTDKRVMRMRSERDD